MQKFFEYLTSLNTATLNLVSLIEKQFVGSVFAEDDEKGADDDRGFGQVYKWRNFHRGFEEAKETGKPIFLVIHRTWCPACRRLKDKFSKSMQLIDLSSRFVMINVASETDLFGAGDKNFEPDGRYVPRILFYTPQGELIDRAYNRHANDPKFQYFYRSPNEIVESMRFVLEDYPTPNDNI